MLAALSVRLEFKGALHQRADGVREKTGELVKTLELQPITLDELRLVVPRVHMAGATVDKKPDHRLGLGRKMRGPRGQRINRPLPRRRQQALLLQQAGERHGANPHAATLQHGAPV